MGVQERISELLAPLVDDLDLDLVDVEYGGSTLRVVVDAPLGQGGGINTDQLATANRAISTLLDEHDPIPGRYTLEVSSPGVERPLRRLDHFERAVGEDVIVKLLPGIEPRRLRGRLESADASRLSILVEEIDGVSLSPGEVREVAVDDIDKARTVFEWGPAPKPGGAKKSGASKPGGAKKSGASKQSGTPEQSSRESKEEAE